MCVGLCMLGEVLVCVYVQVYIYDCVIKTLWAL